MGGQKIIVCIEYGIRISLLVEGMSIRSVERITKLHRDTICDLIVHVGQNCEKHMQSLRQVPATDVQADEIWSYVGCKEKTKKRLKRSEEMGDAWTFIAVDRETKFVL